MHGTCDAYNPEVGAKITAALGPIRDRLFRAARAQGRHEPLEAYAADALVELADGASRAGGVVGAAKATADGGVGGKTAKRNRGGTSAAKVIVRVDLDALLRGYPVAGETAELVGYGPVAVSAITELIDTGDPFLAAVVTRGVDEVGVAHLGRRPTAFQQTCLEWLYPTCAAEGCSVVARLEVDHRLDWATSRMTLLDRLCSHHHELQTLDGWSLVEGRGKRAFVPPDDPRHPRHRRGRRRGEPGPPSVAPEPALATPL